METFCLKRCGTCTVLSNSWEFNRGGFEHERCCSSSPLKTGILDPTTSANAELYFTVQFFIQNRSELQGKTQITDMKGGKGQSKAKVKQRMAEGGLEVRRTRLPRREQAGEEKGCS